MKALYLLKLYKHSLQHYNNVSSFKDIASLAIMEINRYLDLDPSCDDTHDFYTINSPITLIRWFRMYREKDGFSNILPISNANRLPAILSDNPEIVHSLKQFCKNNISSLTIELAHNHIHTVIIPGLVKKIAEERNIPHYSK